MSKVLKIAAIVVGVAAVVVTAGAALGLIPAVLGTVGGLTITATGLAAALGVAASVLSVAAGLLAPKPGFGKIAGAGTQLDFTADPTAGLPYVMGNARVGQAIVHEASWGDKNRYLGIVGVLSCAGPIFAYDGFYADDTLVSFSGPAATGYYAGFLYQWMEGGHRPAAVLLSMTAPDASVMPNWGTGHGLSSLASAGQLLIADVDNGQIYSGGVPQMTHQIRGVTAYDPRQDTYYGGSGSQNTIIQGTWTYSENPWAHHGTFAMGRVVNGIRVIGPGLPASSIDFPAHMEAANIADANGWKISGRVLSTDSKWDTLKAIAQAGGGYPIPSGAKLSCLINTPRVSLETIGEEHIKGPVSVPQMAMRRDRLNGATARYREPSQAWQIVSGNTIRSSAYLAADGGTARTREIDLPLVADKDQAAQLVAYEVANSRERAPITITVDLYWSQYKMGDCLTLNIPSALLFNQKAVIISRELDAASNTITFQFRTETDAKHAWALGVSGGSAGTAPVGSTPGTGDTGSTLSQAQITLLIKNSTVSGLGFTISDTGAVNISSHIRIYADKSVSVNGTTSAHTVSGAAAGDGIYIYYDDLNRVGGAESYQHLKLAGNTGDASGAFASSTNPGRHFVCYGVVPAAGGTTGGGSDVGAGGGVDSDACVIVGTPILMADGTEMPADERLIGRSVRTRHEHTLEWGDFEVFAAVLAPDQPVFVASIGGNELRGTGDHRIWIDGEWKRLREIGREDGIADVMKITVAEAHTYVSNGVLSHNIKYQP